MVEYNSPFVITPGIPSASYTMDPSQPIVPGSNQLTVIQTGGKASKVVRGAVLQSRPSASHYYKKLGKPIGTQVTYRPRKGGKYILHELRLRKNGSPYWKALEALPKTKKQLSRKRSQRRSRGRRTRGRKSRGRRTRGRR